MPKALSIKNLTKNYGKFEAVKGISINIEKGDFFGFLGPNGAGKTTTINSIIGLANFDSGSITVFGKDVVKEYRKARNYIGIVHQEFNFDPFFAIRDVLIYHAGYFGMKKQEAEKHTDKLLKDFELWDARKKTMRQISGGMKRRLLIAKALIHNPKILILDEPTAGIDVELRRALWKYLKKINKEGTTILLTTHYIEEAEALCNKIGIIHHGKIIALDDKKKLMKNLSKDTIIIGVSAITNLKATLNEYNYTLKNKKLSIEVSDADKDLPKVLELLRKKNIAVTSIDIKRKSLEDIFVEVTA